MREIKESLDRYLAHRIMPGSFLTAVLENDLFGAMRRADKLNRMRIHQICSYIATNLPLDSYGSPEKVKQWVRYSVEDHEVF